jgi:protease I
MQSYPLYIDLEAGMKLNGMNVLVIVGPEFEDLEFWVPVMRLREEGASVTIAGLKALETYRGKYGVTARSDVNIDEVNSSDFEAIVIPGGWAPDKLRRSESLKRVVREMDTAKKTIGMICHAGLVGISAGIVKGHIATGSLGIKDDLINAGAIWKDEPAFRSGNLVWGRVVPDIPDFCRELIASLVEQIERKS